jgi:hypothetical protein
MKKHNIQNGFTLIELMITVLAVMVLVIGISGMLAAGHKGYNNMFARVTSDVVRNSYEARSIFDSVIRKSVYEFADLNTTRDTLVVYYYPNPSDLSTIGNYPTMYAMFYKSGKELKLQRGSFAGWPPPLPPSPGANDTVIAKNVTFVEFTITGASIRMSLTLDNTNEPTVPNKLRTAKIDVTTTAFRFNKLPN